MRKSIHNTKDVKADYSKHLKVKPPLKVEISVIDDGWKWLGHLTQEQLDLLCKMADGLSDLGEES